MIDIMAWYLTKYGKPKFFAFHYSIEKIAGASLQLCNAWTPSDLLTYPFDSSTYPSTHIRKTSTISCLLITYTLSLAQSRYLPPWLRMCSEIPTLHQALVDALPIPWRTQMWIPN
jgi:hypothetical protein